MNVSKMTGTPWHTERVHRSEGDDRRYKGRCKFYRYESKYCSYRCGKCIGSAHCREYQAISNEEFKKRQKDQNKKKAKKSTSDDDIFWY